jgi:CHAT domain-containing protein
MSSITRIVLLSVLSLALAAEGLAQGTQRAPENALAPGPFLFREVYPLEFRVQSRKQAYDPNHGAQQLSQMNYGPANPMLQFQQDRRNRPETYSSHDWVNLLPETDIYLQMGSLDLAEKQYLDIVDRLRKAQGPASSDLAFMLDHLAEFYLEERKFESAYKTFSDAVQVRRSSLSGLKKAVDSGSALSLGIEDPDGAFIGYQLHLADLLTRLGQLDLGKGDLAAARVKLGEAVSLLNLPNNTWYVPGLYGLYFRSRVFERQGNWNAAEMLWHEAAAKRQVPEAAGALAQVQIETADFYARKGDFHAAAEIAGNLHAGTAARTQPSPKMLGAMRATLLNNRPASHRLPGDGATALREIIALDTWHSQGADAAAALLPQLFGPVTNDLLDRGSDAERSQLLAWFERRVFLHLSILLDGDPQQKRIEDAYALLSNVKGRFFARMKDVTSRVEMERGNPNTDIPEFKILDQLAAARQKQSHLFIEGALDGRSVDPAEFVANDNAERILTDALATGVEGLSTYFYFSLPALGKALPPEGAFIDFVRWERSSRDSGRQPQMEYGAFVIRRDHPLRYVDLGAADAIDSEIDKVLAAGRDLRGLCSQRGFQIESGPEVSAEQFKQDLRDLYKSVIAPLEPALEGATKLYMAPDGKLALAPVSAFIDGKGHYLLESRTTTYEDSWRDLSISGQWGPGANQANSLVVANPDFDLALSPVQGQLQQRKATFAPLPGTQMEGTIVLKAIGAPQDRLLTGNMARQTLVQSINHPEIEHFATHSFFDLPWTPTTSPYHVFEFPAPYDTEYPLLQAGIALSGANRVQNGPEDGLLTGLEVSSLRLEGTQLAVLSSCDSGQGTVLAEQGILGLRAALSMAGAESTVMTLWPICDVAGAKFMQFFYSHLSQPPAGALRLAQQDMIASGSFADPRYWSGYLVSAQGIITPGKASPAPNQLVSSQPSIAAAANVNQPFLITPRCFHILSHSDQQGPQMRTHYDTEIKIGGVIRRVQSTPTQAIYDLSADGNNVEAKSYIDRVLGSDSDILASERKWLVQALVERQPDSSSVTFRFGPVHQNPEQNRVITLKGKADLFPSLDLPDALPPIGPDISVTDSYAVKGAVDQIGSCPH